jgi:hypothetical protein
MLVQYEKEINVGISPSRRYQNFAFLEQCCYIPHCRIVQTKRR